MKITMINEPIIWLISKIIIAKGSEEANQNNLTISFVQIISSNNCIQTIYTYVVSKFFIETIIYKKCIETMYLNNLSKQFDENLFK
jgi:hypothetical protein